MEETKETAEGERWTCTPEEARQILGYGRNQMYDALKAGKIEYIRDNARYRVLMKPLMKKVSGSA